MISIEYFIIIGELSDIILYINYTRPFSFHVRNVKEVKYFCLLIKIVC